MKKSTRWISGIGYYITRNYYTWTLLTIPLAVVALFILIWQTIVESAKEVIEIICDKVKEAFSTVQGISWSRQAFESKKKKYGRGDS